MWREAEQLKKEAKNKTLVVKGWKLRFEERDSGATSKGDLCVPSESFFFDDLVHFVMSIRS